MKKIITLISLTFILCSASAQSIYFGPVVGMNVTTLTRTTGAKSNIKGNVGAMLGFKIGNLIGVQAEGLFSWQGSEVRLNDQNREINTTYLKVPVVAKIGLIAGLNIEVGASFDFLLSDMPNLPGEGSDIPQFFNDFDFNIPVGINWVFLGKVEVGARYYIPTNISMQIIEEGWAAKNSTFTLSVRYRL